VAQTPVCKHEVEGSNPGHMLKNKLITRPFFILAKLITRTRRTGMLVRGEPLYSIGKTCCYQAESRKQI